MRPCRTPFFTDEYPSTAELGEASGRTDGAKALLRNPQFPPAADWSREAQVSGMILEIPIQQALLFAKMKRAEKLAFQNSKSRRSAIWRRMACHDLIILYIQNLILIFNFEAEHCLLFSSGLLIANALSAIRPVVNATLFKKGF